MAINPDKLQQFIDALIDYDSDPENPLNAEQRDGYDKLITHLVDAQDDPAKEHALDGYYDMATGTGKTVLFNGITKALLSKPALDDKKTRVLILVPTQQLLEQTVESLSRFYPEFFPNNDPENKEFSKINMDGAQVGAYYTERKDTDRPITITTYQSLTADFKKKPDSRFFKPENFDLLILDEAHKALGKQTLDALHTFDDKAVRLGFSATNEYNAEKSVAALLLKHCLHKIDVAEAHDKELLSPFGCYIVRTKMEVDKSKIDVRGKGDSRDFNAGVLAKMLNTQTRNMKAVKMYMNWQDPETGERLFGQTGIVSCTDTKHADDVAVCFNETISETPGFKQWLEDEAKIRAELADKAGNKELAERFRKEGIQVCATIDYKTPPKVRRQLIADHRAGKLLVLAGVRIPGEGFDSPRTGFLFSLSDTLSLPKKKQEGGRVLRLHHENPGKYGRIFEFVDDEKYLETVGTDRAPILYPETLSPDFKFRSSGEVAETKKSATKSGEYHEPPPLPSLEDQFHDYDDVIVDEPQKVLEFARNRAASRPKDLGADKAGWISSSQIASQLGFGTSENTRMIADRVLERMAASGESVTLPGSMDATTVNALIMGPSRDGRNVSMFMGPRLYIMKMDAITAELSEAGLPRLDVAHSMPERRREWIPAYELPALAAQFGIDPPPSVSAVEKAAAKLKPNQAVSYRSAPGKPLAVANAKSFVDGPYFNGQRNTLVVHPDAAFYLLQTALGLNIDASIPELAQKKGHIFDVEAIAAQLNVEPTNDNITRINQILSGVLEKAKQQRPVDISIVSYTGRPDVVHVHTLLTEVDNKIYMGPELLPMMAWELGVPPLPFGKFIDWWSPTDFVAKLGLGDDPTATKRIDDFLKELVSIKPDEGLFSARPASGSNKLKDCIKFPFLEMTEDGFTTSVRAHPDLIGRVREKFAPSLVLEYESTPASKSVKWVPAESFLARIGRTPNAQDIETIEKALAEHKKIDPKTANPQTTNPEGIEIRPTSQGDKYFIRYDSKVLQKVMTDALGLPTFLDTSAKYQPLTLPEAAAALAVGSDSDSQQRFQEAVEALRASDKDNEKIKGPHTISSGYSGLLIHDHNTLNELRDLLNAQNAPDAQIAEQHKPLADVVGWIDGYLMREPVKRKPVEDFCNYLTAHQDKILRVSDHFSHDLRNLRESSTESREINIGSLISPIEGDHPYMHPTLLPYLCMALGQDPTTSRSLANYLKLFPEKPKEHANWLPLDSMKPLGDIPPKSMGVVRPLLGKWIAEGKQVTVDGQPKDVIDMVGIHPGSLNKLTYYLDPQLVPEIAVAVAEGQGEDLFKNAK